MSEAKSASLLSGIRLEDARERISTFSEFGLAHLYFAQHAAFPMSLTADLLYRLWANFQRDIDDEKLHIPWIAVADLLLSSLCEEVGHELYEMDVMIRAELLSSLKANPKFGQRRISELSYFLLDYVRQQLHSSNLGIRNLAEAQQWTALAYTQPGRAAHELAEALTALDQNNKVEQVRLVSLMETLNMLAEPLSVLEGFAPLLTYARGVERMARSDAEGAKAQFRAVKEGEQIELAIGVRLPTFEQLRGERKGVTQQVQDTRIDFFITYHSADTDWAQWIAWQLEETGYSIELQAWAFQLGANFEEEMDAIAELAKRLIVILSPNYLDALVAIPEWIDAFWQYPRNGPDFIVGMHVRECSDRLNRILGSVDYTNFVGLNEEAAREALLARVSSVPNKTAISSHAPVEQRSVSERPQFPAASWDKCPFCGAETWPEDVFCLNCGNRLTPVPFSSQQVQTAFEAMIPAQEDWAAPSQSEATIPPSDKAVEVFLICSHEDQQFLSEIERVLALLRRRGLIAIWHDRMIMPGSVQADEIDSYLNTAQIILVLVSPNFLASDYCYGIEMKRALARHELGETLVIPIILRPCIWEEAPFGKLRALPRNSRPISRWANPDEAFFDVIRDLQQAIEQFIERNELRRVGEAVAAKGMHANGELTYAEWLRESGLGEDEWQRGKIRVAYTRFTGLLARIEALPESASLGPGSYEHCQTLGWLARCLRDGGHPAAAEDMLHKTLTMIEALLSQQPENESYLRERGVVLTDLADVLRDQGKYSQARKAYEESLQIAKQLGDLRSQGVALTQLGTLALLQREYAVAQSRYAEALQLIQTFGEPALEAIAWHQLGMVAQEQEKWAEAERCYRESLSIKERLGDAAGAAMTCNQLGKVSEGAGRPVEAEGWYRRAIELKAQVEPDSSSLATSLSNLAALLLGKVRANRTDATSLAEAKRYAEQALAIRETFDTSSEIWTTLNVLAEIADLEGHAEEARSYRRRERETYAAFVGNRYHIDQQHGQLIKSIAAAAQGSIQAREEVEAVLPQLEERGWKIAAPTQRIWSGERDWNTLAEEVDRQDALLILRVLETIAQPEEVQGKTPEEVIASLPITIREALEQGNQDAFQQAFEALSSEEQQAVVEAIQYLQAQQEEEEGDDEDKEPEIADVVQQFEPLLQAIALSAGDTAHRDVILETLSNLETNLEIENWEFRQVVQLLWAGERDVTTLTAGLNEMDTALVQRVLEIFAGAGK